MPNKSTELYGLSTDTVTMRCVHPSAVKRLAWRSLVLLGFLWLMATAATWIGNQPDDSAHSPNGVGGSGGRAWLRFFERPKPPLDADIVDDADAESGAWRRGKERQSFVYIKVIKSASETITSMLRRFGLSRRVNFAMPLPNKIYLGWPNQLSREHMVLQPGVTHPSVLLDQCVYNRTFLDGLMARPCVYITSLREPFRQMQSLFIYYNLGEISGIGSRPDGFDEYLRNMSYYDSEYQSQRRSAKRYCVPDNFSLTRNTMSRILGYVEGQDTASFVTKIMNEFDLILITDYFMHSLVLLKRLMNWSFKDILFVSRNIGRYPRLTARQRPDLAAIHRAWSPVDYQLFKAANATFWRRVAQEGPSFRTELRVFRSLSKFIRRRCRALSRKARADDFTFLANRWSDAFTIGPADCERLEQDGAKEIQQMSQQFYAGDRASLSKYTYC